MDRQGRAHDKQFSPVAQVAATSDAEMSANIVDVGGRSNCQCRHRKFPGEMFANG
jgi:hypothetical protein